VRGREHVLLSVLLEQAWSDGRDVTLETLIADVQRPPVDRIGVMAVDAFAPPAERTALAMQLNALLAAPGFEAWRRGEPLDAASLLYAPDGRPRIGIVSIAHLSDRERMFLVTLLLGEIVSWMRRQPGTSSLRAILYMDEVFGYLPPVAEPPSKTALLTLLKQARAHGLGVVLATQNPVDLDYKALSNAGTWFVGRLQTERDKARLLDGLTGAASGGGLDRAAIDARLSSLGKRTFLLHDVHADAPVVMESRWALSYLRGPLTSTQIATLMAGRTAKAEVPPREPAAPASGPTAPASRPALEPGVPEVFLTPADGAAAARYAPYLLASVRLHYVRASVDVDAWRTVRLLAAAPARAGRVAWAEAEMLSEGPALDDAPRPAMGFDEPGSVVLRARSYRDFATSLATHLYRAEALVLWRSKRPKAVSGAQESEGAFRGRLLHLWREERDAAVETLRRRYAPKLERCERAIRTAEARLERERAQYGHQRTQTAISLGATVLGTLFGRKLGSATGVGRAATTARAASRAARERDDIARAEAEVSERREALAALDAEFQAELRSLEVPRDPADFELDEYRIAPRKSDVTVERLALAWRPVS
jgi:hypothetical protein